MFEILKKEIKCDFRLQFLIEHKKIGEETFRWSKKSKKKHFSNNRKAHSKDDSALDERETMSSTFV